MSTFSSVFADLTNIFGTPVIEETTKDNYSSETICDDDNRENYDIDFNLISATRQIFNPNCEHEQQQGKDANVEVDIEVADDVVGERKANLNEVNLEEIAGNIIAGELEAGVHVVAEEVEDVREGGLNNGDSSLTSKKRTGAEKHPLLPPCHCKHKKCHELLSESRREIIHNKFWEKTHNEQNQWLLAHISMAEKQRSRKRKSGENNLRKERVILAFTLPKELGVNISVCQQMFLNTLGYTSNQKIVTLFENSEASDITVRDDQRGKRDPPNKKDADTYAKVKEHIFSYHPSVSHYRRKHAPFRLYLSPEINMVAMYKDFNEKYPNMVSREFYRQQLRKYNISFCKLGEEECDFCLLFQSHAHDDVGEEDSLTKVGDFIYVKGCEVCDEHQLHMQNASSSRKQYREDKEKNCSDTEKYFSVDMQKVIMLPVMMGVKKCVFTQRLTAFHLTFAPLGGKKISREKPTGVIWHDGIAGRNDEDVTSAYIRFLKSPEYRDLSDFIFWADNCSAQNKNWTLYTALAYYINNPSVAHKTITLKYFEPGHTFMSADSFHHLIESEIRARKFLYDFQDFASVIDKKGHVMSMEGKDFTDYVSKKSDGKYTNYPLLDDVKVVQFRKDSTKMYWKSNICDENFKSGEFLQKKTIKSIQSESGGRDTIPLPRSSNKGISKSRKEGIINKLCPLMHKNRWAFWLSLDENESDD